MDTEHAVAKIRENASLTHVLGEGHALRGAGAPCPAGPCSAFTGGNSPEQSSRASLPLFDVGNVGDDVNEPRVSIHKPGGLQTCCSLVHTKARLAAAHLGMLTAGSLMHCVRSIKLSVGNAGSGEPAKPKRSLCFSLLWLPGWALTGFVVNKPLAGL